MFDVARHDLDGSWKQGDLQISLYVGIFVYPCMHLINSASLTRGSCFLKLIMHKAKLGFMGRSVKQVVEVIGQGERLDEMDNSELEVFRMLRRLGFSDHINKDDKSSLIPILLSQIPTKKTSLA